MLWWFRRCDLDFDQADPVMSGMSLTTSDKLVFGLLGVAICTQIVSGAASKLGWTPFAIAAALHFAGRAAELK